MGDREHPRPETVLVTLEPREIAMHLGEHVICQAIGIGGAVPPEIRSHLAGQ
jgi:hypothetical protein